MIVTPDMKLKMWLDENPEYELIWTETPIKQTIEYEMRYNGNLAKIEIDHRTLCQLEHNEVYFLDTLKQTLDGANIASPAPPEANP